MAKGARASTRKRNNVNLRTKVFGPAHDARTARLSAKLQEIANAPKPETEKQMQVDDKEDVAGQDEGVNQDDKDEAMQWSGIAASSKGSRSTKSAGRIEKKIPKRRKARNQMVFQSETARKRRQSKGKKK